jgi:hypothetical protein
MGTGYREVSSLSDPAKRLCTVTPDKEERRMVRWETEEGGSGGESGDGGMGGGESGGGMGGGESGGSESGSDE